MHNVQRYFYSNLYLFLPSVLILALLPLLFALFEHCWIRIAADTFSGCNFSYGAGSRNLCDNGILFSTFLWALCLAIPLAFLLTAGLSRLLHIHWLPPYHISTIVNSVSRKGMHPNGSDEFVEAMR
jgi:hypothetical protein